MYSNMAVALAMLRSYAVDFSVIYNHNAIAG